MSTRVLLVDDHPVVRAGLSAVVESRGFTVVGEAATGEEAVELATDLAPDVVLCDLRLGEGMDGVATTAQLRRLARPPAVIILTTFDHDAQIVRAIEAGAAGYLLKDVDTETIARAIVDAASGAMVLAPAMTARIVQAMRAPRVELTAREQDVLRLMDHGASNREIAAQLFISEATVKTHVVHILEKFGADSRTRAISEARQQGVL